MLHNHVQNTKTNPPKLRSYFSFSCRSTMVPQYGTFSLHTKLAGPSIANWFFLLPRVQPSNEVQGPLDFHSHDSWSVCKSGPYDTAKWSPGAKLWAKANFVSKNPVKPLQLHTNRAIPLFVLCLKETNFQRCSIYINYNIVNPTHSEIVFLSHRTY